MQLEHFAEETAFLLEFGGGADFGNFVFVEDNDLVGVCDGAHAVSDDDDGLVLHKFRNALLDLGFVLRTSGRKMNLKRS